MLSFFVFRIDFRFLNFDIVFFSQPTQGFCIAQLFVLHQKADGVAAFATAKTLVYFFGRRDRKRRCFFAMKRAEAKVIGAPSFELHKIAHYFEDVDTVDNALYGFLTNHRAKVTAILNKKRGISICFSHLSISKWQSRGLFTFSRYLWRIPHSHETILSSITLVAVGSRYWLPRRKIRFAFSAC